jgi:hypothetical protein
MDPAPRSARPPGLPPAVAARLRLLGEALSPEAAALDDAGWRRAEAIIAGALAQRPPAVRRQLVLFVRLATGLLPVLFTGRSLRRLDPAARRVFLERLSHSGFLLLRRGVWGVRTLVFMGVYGQDVVRERIGFRAHPDGWEARRDGAGEGA